MSGNESVCGTVAIDGHDFMKVKDVVKALNLSRSTVYSLMDKGVLTYCKFPSTRRVRRVDVEAYIRANTIPARA